MASKSTHSLQSTSNSSQKHHEAESQQSQKQLPLERQLYKKLLNVQQKVESVPKRGFNAFHKYHYATETDILSVKATLNEEGLIVVPTTVEQETGFKPDGKGWAKVTLLFRVIDVTTGETIVSQFTGYAEDAHDKAIYKATTGANKYFYLKFFGIPTEDDPEREDGEVFKSKSFGDSPIGTGEAGKTNRLQSAEKQTGAASESRKTQALIYANKILSLQKQHSLSNEDVLTVCEIDSVKRLAEAADGKALANAYNKLERFTRQESVSQKTAEK